MKFKIQMKDPDGVFDSLQDAVKESVDAIAGLSEDDKEALRESRQDQMAALIGKWFKYQEYLTVEVDTESETCVVLPK